MTSTRTLKIIAQNVARILHEEMDKRNIPHEFGTARIFDAKSVGVQGDERSYGYPAEIELKVIDNQVWWDKDFLSNLSTRITNEEFSVTRVTLSLLYTKEYVMDIPETESESD